MSETKHDGYLDAKHQYQVSYWPDRLEERFRIYIEENDILTFEPAYVALTPTQALSLLTWLAQEKPELERLAAKEQQSEHV